MKILYPWLEEFVAVKAAPAELRARLSMAGVPVDAILETAAGPVLDVELFMNRPDCMGHLGIAREVATLYRLPLKAARAKLNEAADKAADATRVEIDCPDVCGRYTARVIRGVKVGPSPDWLRQRLEAIGQQSINNVVDATNYVMFELGQPLHAFDLDKLAERRIVVRRARKGEKMRTLDGIERALAPEMCMIADAKRSIAVGGVMGGAETEISFSSKNVLLESAWFDPVSIRKTAKALGLRTEASVRFERGADPEMAELASQRCAELIQKLAGGEILAGVVDVYPARRETEKIELTRKELLRVMGADVPDREIEEILDGLGFEPQRVDANRGSAGSLLAAWECRRPSWRHDATREIDLVEEVARLYGFEKFPVRLPAAKQPAARLPRAAAEDRLRDRLVAAGYHEIVSIPLVNGEDDAVFRADGVAPARLANPLAEDAATLRTTGLLSILRALEWNINRGQRNVRLFEIGRTYQLRDAQPVETPVLTLGATGLARPQGVHEPPREFTFADLKGALDALGELAGGLRWEAGGPDWLHPARCGRMATNGSRGAESGGKASAPEAIGVAGQLARRVAERFKLRQDVFLAELLLEPFCGACDAAGAVLRYEPLPRFPAVERDLSLVLADGTTFAEIAGVIHAQKIAELTSIEPLDLFRGGQIPMGKYSLLVRVTFQSHEGTLTDAQANDYRDRIAAALEKKLGATLRTA